jgi:hypothetical protein
MQIFVPLTKIDEEKRLVIGRAGHEVPDKSGEIMDYETAKPAFQQWSAYFEQATGGLSKGNLRAMHNPKLVAGKVTDIAFDDAQKAIDVVAKIVDDQEWKKVLDGVYVGFSVGGSYLRKWKDGELTRYTPKVSEISLVDSPCIPTCRIAELHKADGSVVEHVLKGRAPRSYAELAPPRSYGELAKAGRLESRWRTAGRRGRKWAQWGAALGAGTAGGMWLLARRPTPFGIGARTAIAAKGGMRRLLPRHALYGAAGLGGFGAGLGLGGSGRRERAEKADGFSLTDAYLAKAWGAGIARLGRQAVRWAGRQGLIPGGGARISTRVARIQSKAARLQDAAQRGGGMRSRRIVLGVPSRPGSAPTAAMENIAARRMRSAQRAFGMALRIKNDAAFAGVRNRRILGRGARMGAGAGLVGGAWYLIERRRKRDATRPSGAP